MNAVWKKGQLQAERIFEGYYGSRINFAEQFSKANCDLLQPNGDYVGVNYSSNDACSEEENPDPLSHYTNYVLAENPELPETEADGDTYDHELGMGLEDLLPETPEGIETDAEPLAFSKKISYEGKEILKTSLISTLNNSKSKKVPWRTWHVCNVAIDDLYNSKQEEMDSDDMEDEEYMKKDDLASALVHSGAEICLSAIEVKEFKFGTDKASHVTAALSDLEDITKSIKVIGQIIALVPSTARADFWEWSQDYISVHTTNDQLTHQQYVVEIPSFFIHPLAPSVVDKPPYGSSADHEHYPTWRLSKMDLQNVLDSLWDSLKPDTDKVVGNVHLLLSTKNSNALPYQHPIDGTKYFL